MALRPRERPLLLQRSWCLSAHQQMRYSRPLNIAGPLPRPNMTAPKNNFYCVTDSAPMSEPGEYGVGTIGIVSYSATINPHKSDCPPTTRLCNPLSRREKAEAALNQIALLSLICSNGQQTPRRAICANLAPSVCEMSEQTGSASETKGPLLNCQKMAGLIFPQRRSTKTGRSFKPCLGP